MPLDCHSRAQAVKTGRPTGRAVASWGGSRPFGPRDYWESTTGGNSSWYDFNQDSLTNQCDVRYITDGKCPRSK